MRRLFRWVFRLALGLLILAVVGAAAILFWRDTLARNFLVSRLHSKTGLTVSIGAVHVGLRSPVISLENVKLYNTPEFGGSLCLDMPELRIEYDLSELRARRLHLTFLRLNLAQVSVLQDKNGRNNFGPMPKKSKDLASRKRLAGKWEFTGIDLMDVTLGKFRHSNMATGRGEEMTFGITNQILRHVKTEQDLSPLGVAFFPRDKVTAPGEPDVGLNELLDKFLEAP